MKDTSYDVVVIGAGPAGMTAAFTAARRGLSVCLAEKNKTGGKKLLITGKGRCNLTNNCDVQELLRNVPVNPRFLYSAFTAFDTTRTMQLFEELGVTLVTERGGRVFPASGRAADINNALLRHVSESGAEFRRGRVLELYCTDGHVTGVSTESGEIRCSSAVVATGGLSYPLTGSTGDGYAFARGAGHTIIKPRGSLVPLCSDDPICSACQGLSLKNVAVTLFDDNGSRLYGDFGELLFTHFGLSGPVILSASAHIRKPERPHFIDIDLKPALSEEILDLRVRRDFEERINRDFGNALGGLLPRLLVPEIVRRSGIPPETKVHTVTRDQRKVLVRLLKKLRIGVTGLRPVSEAIVTSGGVHTREVDPRTMQSKLVRGLYFAGEVLDTDAYTGGYNLQIAFSTGYLAGISVPKNSADGGMQ